MFVLNGNSEQIMKLFKPFGLSEYEARVHFTLQVCGKTKAGNLWKKAGVPQTKIYYLLEILTMKGLIETTRQHPREVRTKPFLKFALDFIQEKKLLLK